MKTIPSPAKSNVEGATNDSHPRLLVQIDSIDTSAPDTGKFLIEVAGRHPDSTSGKGDVASGISVSLGLRWRQEMP